jgi:integrase
MPPSVRGEGYAREPRTCPRPSGPPPAPARGDPAATHFRQNGGAVTDLQQQLGHSEIETTQIHAAAVSERRRATVLAMESWVARRG